MRSFYKYLVKILSRRTSGRKLIPEIDGLRSVAILSVIIFHANGNFQYYAVAQPESGWLSKFLINLFVAGEYGVPLFFAISGFILAIPFAQTHLFKQRTVSLKKYFIRRITRLEPPYIFAMTVFFIIAIIRSGAIDSLPHYLASIFYMHNLTYGEPSTIQIIAWSLEVEVQFYILAPIITLLFLIRHVLVRRVIIGLAMLLLAWFFGVDKPIAGRTLLEQSPYFLAGILLADFYLLSDSMKRVPTLKSIPRQLVWDCIAVTSILLVFVAKAYGHLYHIRPEIISPILIVIGYTAVFKAGVVRMFFRLTPVVILGGMCYTIYLWHFTAISLFRYGFDALFVMHDTIWMRIFYICFASVFATSISAVLFALIEKPTMNPVWPSAVVARLRSIWKKTGNASD